MHLLCLDNIYRYMVGFLRAVQEKNERSPRWKYPCQSSGQQGKLVCCSAKFIRVWTVHSPDKVNSSHPQLHPFVDCTMIGSGNGRLPHHLCTPELAPRKCRNMVPSSKVDDPSLTSICLGSFIPQAQLSQISD